MPTDDEAAMAEAILATLEDPPAAQSLRERGQVFSGAHAVAGYHRLFFGEDA